MSNEANKDTVKRFINEVWNKRQFDLLEELLHFPYEINNLLSEAEPAKMDPAGMRWHIQEWIDAFPDLQLTVADMIAEDDQVALLWTMKGTHHGKYRGKGPTGNKINVNAVAVFRLKDGKLHGHSVMVDALNLYQQIGLTSSH
ncbi:MAG TPA: ester cyclase [Anaerolineae bacterium]